MTARTSKPRGKRSLAAPPPSVGLSGRDLLRLIASGRVVPRSEEWRPFFGKALTPERIESAIRSADCGFLQDLTDIGYEQLCYDPHLASLLGKRIGRLGAAPRDLTPAQGSGVDKRYAQKAADLVRTQFDAIPSFSQAVEDLAWSHWDGRGALENHWERVPFGWRLAEFGWVAPRRLALGRARELILSDNGGSFGFEPCGIDIESLWGKFVWLKPRLFNDYPEREGLARHGLFWSFHKRFAARERAIILELLRHGRQLLKEKDDNTTQYDEAELEAHADRLDGMNTGSTAYLPKGLEYDNKGIESDATDGHEKMIESVDRQLSKLVLGGIGTTDEVRGGGLGARTSETHEAQQQFIFDRDGLRVAERFQYCAVRQVVVLNKQRLGIASDDDAIALAPLFSLRTQKAEDREGILKQAKLFLDMGGAVALDELRQRTGFRKPDKDEAILQLTDSQQLEGSARYIEPRVRVVDPTGTEPGQDTHQAPPPVAPTASPDAEPGAAAEETAATAAPPALDLEDDDDWGIYSASVLGVQRELDDLREHLSLADDAGTNFPAAGANLRVSLRNSRFKVFPPAEAAALRAEFPEVWRAAPEPLANLAFRRLSAVAARAGVVETDSEEEIVRLREAWAARHVGDSDLAGVVRQMKWLVVGEQGIDRMRRIVADAKARAGRRSNEQDGDPLLLARQPATPNGSPESIIATRKRAALPVLTAWVSAFERGVSGTTATTVRASLRKVARSLDTAALARHLEPTMLHAAMLGAMDAEHEAEHDVALAPVTFDAHGEPVLLVAGFAAKPFQEAIDAFLAKSILPRSLFDRLEASAKRKAFTIAGLAAREMLQTGFDAVATAIREGRDLRNFRKDLNARFDSAGWTRLDGPHVETIFRNATMGAYASGRDKQMSQPHVLAARPYWQILGVDDARTRDPHGVAHKKVLKASDPFWKRSPLPWGHNCRCRKVSRSKADLKRLGLTVTSGASLTDLPDPGWNASLSLL